MKFLRYFPLFEKDFWVMRIYGIDILAELATCSSLELLISLETTTLDEGLLGIGVLIKDFSESRQLPKRFDRKTIGEKLLRGDLKDAARIFNADYCLIFSLEL